jgi:hypothetical protein
MNKWIRLEGIHKEKKHVICACIIASNLYATCISGTISRSVNGQTWDERQNLTAVLTMEEGFGGA